MSRIYSTKKGHNSPAQGMVEFALALPIFLLLLLGIIEFGRLMAVASSVYTAAREGARYGSAVGPGYSGIPRYQDCTGIRNAAKNVGFFAGLKDTDFIIGYDNTTNERVNVAALPTAKKCSGTSTTYVVTLGDRIVVQVKVMFRFLFLGLPAFPITSQSARTIVSNIDVDVTKGATFTPRPPTAGPSPTPTNTRTITPTPSVSPTPTETPLNWTPPTPTDTDTPTPTVTPTDTLVPTPTVDDVCELIIIRNVSGNLDTYFDLTFYNLSTTTTFWLKDIDASWGPLIPPPAPTPAPFLTHLYIGGQDEIQAPQESPLYKLWDVEASNRDLNPLSDLALNFKFSQDSHIVHILAHFVDGDDPTKICTKIWP